MDNSGTRISAEDLQFLISSGAKFKYTWQDFQDELQAAKETDKNFTAAALIAHELIKPSIMFLASRNGLTSKDKLEDVSQATFLIIYTHIQDYNSEKTEFITYISPFIKGVCRETAGDAARRNYDIVSDQTYDDSGKLVTREYEDESAATEEILANQENAKTDIMLASMINLEDPSKSDLKEVVAFNNFLGGCHEFSTELNEMIKNGIAYDPSLKEPKEWDYLQM